MLNETCGVGPRFIVLNVETRRAQGLDFPVLGECASLVYETILVKGCGVKRM